MMQLHLVSRTGEVVYNIDMELKLEQAYQLLEIIGGSETVRTRRKQLLKTLYHERYLTRKGLVWRLEGVLGRGCYRKHAWWFVFYRDMWVVKKAFLASGYDLSYMWDKERRGYYLRGEGEISEELALRIRGAVNEIDPKQVAVTRRLSPAQRVHQGCSITNLAHNVVRYRREKNR